MLIKNRIISLALVGVMITGMALPWAQANAQSADQITLSVAIPAFQADSISDKLISDFESQHAGVKVQVVSDSPTVPSAALGIEGQLDAVSKYAASADVLYVDTNRISAEATRAGYFLDLAPLVNDDSSFKQDDFFPSVWKAFQWDNGVWALPTATDVVVMVYKPSAFDNANIAYPSDKWTVSDLDNAIRKVAIKDPSGAVTTPGFGAGPGNLALLFHSLTNEALFDTSTVPNAPVLDKPDIEQVLDTWNNLDKDGMVSSTGGGPGGGTTPISVASAFGVLFANATTDTSEKYIGILLPGGKAGLNVQGFSVSAGTQHADLAYALANFLTTRPEVSTTFAASPARKSLVGTSNGPAGFRINVTPEVQALIDAGLANGIAVSDLRYSDYLEIALQDMKLKNLDSKSAAQDAETQAAKNAQSASDKKANLKFTVNEPAPVIAAAANGKVAIKFGIQAFGTLPNQDKWDALIKDFTANDPQVGQVNLVKTRDPIADAANNKNDCYYLGYNNVPSAGLDKLLNLDPFLTADSSFDKNDAVGNSIAQVTRDTKIWAMPLALTPVILKFDPVKFDKTGVKQPENGWGIDAFNDALKNLKVDPKDTPAFVPVNTGGSYLFILIAAYGGMPIDFRTDPNTLNYTDPTNEAAIKQVLDLAKNGYIKYTKLGSLRLDFGGNGDPSTIINSSLNGFNFRFGAAAGNQADPTKDYKPVTYPKGTQLTGVSYSMDTAYIGSTSSSPDGCYRFISTLAKHPEIFSAMPARRSLISDPTISASNGPDLTALYQQFDTVLKDPNTVAIPGLTFGGGNISSVLYQYWMFQAFDSYVLNNGDLDSALKDAQNKGTAFQACAAKIPPLDQSSTDSQRQYIKAFGNCASSVDPALKALFNLIGG